MVSLSSVRESHWPHERQRRARRRQRGAVQACQSADHQHGEHGDHGALRREDRGGAVPRELALQVAQHQEEEKVPHPILPKEEQKKGEAGGLSAARQHREGGQEVEGGGGGQRFCLMSVFLFCLGFQACLLHSVRNQTVFHVKRVVPI